MSEINYGVITVATCNPSYRKMGLDLMGVFASELKKEAGASVVRFGYFGTGNHAGSLVLHSSMQT